MSRLSRRLGIVVATVGVMTACVDGETDSSGVPDVAVGVHPCTGYVTDALWMDSRDVGYLGCGSDAAGIGFWETQDGGDTWTAVKDAETGETFFSTFRVVDVWRSPDNGLLYVSGISTVGDHRVVSMDEAGTLGEVRNNGSLYDYSFTAASYVRTSSGVEVAEALTGAQVLVRKEDPTWRDLHAANDGWANGSGWWESATTPAGSILDLDVHEASIVGCGHTINEPPVVYLPPRSWEFGTDGDGDEDGTVEQLWEVVPLVGSSFSSYYGEMWDIDIDAGGIVVGGVNQAAGEGMIYSIGADWPETGYSVEGWTAFKVPDLLGTDNSTWVRGVCRSGARVVAVGEYSNTSEGFVLVSDDGGSTFTDESRTVSSEKLPPVQRCQVFEDGSWVAAGGSGVFVSGS